MNGKDLLTIMSEVDDDLILKTEVRPQPVRRHVNFTLYIGVAAGICAAALAIFGISHLIDNFGGGSDITTTAPRFTTTIPYTEPSTTPSETDTTTTPEQTDVTTTGIPPMPPSEDDVLFCPDGSGTLSDYLVVTPGQILMPEYLNAKVFSESVDTYYSVTIRISTFLDKEDIRNEIETELARLNSMGCFLELEKTDPASNLHNDFTLKGYVSGDFLTILPGNGEYGYKISWNRK